MDNNAKFRFKGYEFIYNPSKFTITTKRVVKQFNSPLSCVTQDLGFDQRVITGEGILFGYDVMQQYEKLYALFLDKGCGLLLLPQSLPMRALFNKLSVEGNGKYNTISYKFEFLEVLDSISGVDRANKKYHITKEGDTLYSISAFYNISLDELIEKNPDIYSNLKLIKGIKVYL